MICENMEGEAIISSRIVLFIAFQHEMKFYSNRFFTFPSTMKTYAIF
ncbi:MAG: hypothetical protein J7L58_03725 [Thermoplasmata archaeon]|nr:hypothetical protein [Thermoplasmata archaeon]